MMKKFTVNNDNDNIREVTSQNWDYSLEELHSVTNKTKLSTHLIFSCLFIDTRLSLRNYKYFFLSSTGFRYGIWQLVSTRNKNKRRVNIALLKISMICTCQ